MATQEDLGRRYVWHECTTIKEKPEKFVWAVKLIYYIALLITWPLSLAKNEPYICGCSYRHSASTFSHHAQHHCLPMLTLAEHFTISKLCMTTKWLYVACHIPTLFWYCPALHCILRTVQVAQVQVQFSSLLIKCSHIQYAAYNIHS